MGWDDWLNGAFVKMATVPYQEIPIYATPEKSGKISRYCFPGEILQVQTASEDWCMVAVDSGGYGAQNGFIQTELLTFLLSR